MHQQPPTNRRPQLGVSSHLMNVYDSCLAAVKALREQLWKLQMEHVADTAEQQVLLAEIEASQVCGSALASD